MGTVQLALDVAVTGGVVVPARHAVHPCTGLVLLPGGENEPRGQTSHDAVRP